MFNFRILASVTMAFMSFSCRHTTSSEMKLIGGSPLPQQHPLRASTVGIGRMSENQELKVYCSGTIINLKTDPSSKVMRGEVLTAAHCVDKSQEALIVFGDEPKKTRDTAKVEDSRIYDFNDRTFGPYLWRYDFAVLHFTTPLRTDLAPAALETSTIKEAAPFDATAVGYGLFASAQNGVRLHAPFQATLAPNGLYKGQLFVASKTASTCHGDSGGGLFRETETGWKLVGVAQGYDSISTGNQVTSEVIERCQKSKIRYSYIGVSTPWLQSIGSMTNEPVKPLEKNPSVLPTRASSSDIPNNIADWCRYNDLASPKNEQTFLTVVSLITLQYLDKKAGSWDEERKKIAESNPIDFATADCKRFSDWALKIKELDINVVPWDPTTQPMIQDPVFKQLISSFSGIETFTQPYATNTEDLPTLPNLRKLIISYSTLDGDSVNLILKKYPSLESLGISSMRINQMPFTKRAANLSLFQCSICKIKPADQTCPMKQLLDKGEGCYFGEPLVEQRNRMDKCLDPKEILTDEYQEYCLPLAATEIAMGNPDKGKAIFQVFRDAKVAECDQKADMLRSDLRVPRGDIESFLKECPIEHMRKFNWLEAYYLDIPNTNVQ